jgi:hypothetical protein
MKEYAIAARMLNLGQQCTTGAATGESGNMPLLEPGMCAGLTACTKSLATVCAMHVSTPYLIVIHPDMPFLVNAAAGDV